MLTARINGETRCIGKSQGYKGLPIRDEMVVCPVNGKHTLQMVTAWEPTPAELEKLNKGAVVYLRVLGTQHPPVAIDVGPAPTIGPSG
jgi:hypothetical protein